jgi:Polyribonucleotide nucleotidyltransferase (polynucleotide phosphorylase)
MATTQSHDEFGRELRPPPLDAATCTTTATTSSDRNTRTDAKSRFEQFRKQRQPPPKTSERKFPNRPSSSSGNSGNSRRPPPRPLFLLRRGDIVQGTVTRLEPYGAFLSVVPVPSPLDNAV